jgi:hypothetical protein
MGPPIGITCARHSDLIDRTNRSAYAFRFGLRLGSLMERLPSVLGPLVRHRHVINRRLLGLVDSSHCENFYRPSSVSAITAEAVSGPLCAPLASSGPRGEALSSFRSASCASCFVAPSAVTRPFGVRTQALQPLPLESSMNTIHSDAGEILGATGGQNTRKPLPLNILRSEYSQGTPGHGAPLDPRWEQPGMLSTSPYSRNTDSRNTDEFSGTCSRIPCKR